MTEDTVGIARAAYDCYVTKDRAAIKALISDDFHFTSPLDNRIDRATYFLRCWPNSASTEGNVAAVAPSSAMICCAESTPRPGISASCTAP